MKQSVIVAAVNEAVASFGKLGDVSCVRIAEALGIIVEPDEPALPDILDITVYSNKGSSYTLGESLSNRSVTVTIAGGSFDFNRALALALVSAYNNRPRWRTSNPTFDGHYLVKIGNDAHTAFYRCNKGWTFDREGGGLFLYVSEWMELPAR